MIHLAIHLLKPGKKTMKTISVSKVRDNLGEILDLLKKKENRF
jgi:hypothetical protein